MIDRKARDKMSETIRNYMNENITAFDFDEAISKIAENTTDRTAEIVGSALWFYYDDNRDHKIVADREVWNYFNRMLLLLDSNAEIETVKINRYWHFSQAVAAACLVLFGYIIFRKGIGEHLLDFTFPLGIISMILYWFNQRKESKRVSEFKVSIPFQSIRNLLSVRRQVPSFIKIKYPKTISVRRVRGKVMEKAMLLPWIFIWLMLSPIVLFFQMFPNKESETRIKISEPENQHEILPANI